MTLSFSMFLFLYKSVVFTYNFYGFLLFFFSCAPRYFNWDQAPAGGTVPSFNFIYILVVGGGGGLIKLRWTVRWGKQYAASLFIKYSNQYCYHELEKLSFFPEKYALVNSQDTLAWVQSEFYTVNSLWQQHEGLSPWCLSVLLSLMLKQF